jgi:hypothetical protein
MLKTLSLWLLLSASLAARAQQATVSNVSGGAQKGHELNFPMVKLPNAAAARKINEYMQINVLERTTLKWPGTQV